MIFPEDFFRWLVIFFVRPQRQKVPLFVSRLFKQEKIGKALARIVLAVALSLLPAGLSSADQPRKLNFNIPQQSVQTALDSLATQANVFLLFPFDQVIAIDANAVQGTYSIQQALDILLQNTGLSGDLTEGGVIAISQAGEIASATENNGKGKRMNTNKRKNLLATFVALFAAGATTQGAMAQTESATEQSQIDEIIVTATKRETNLQDTPMSISVITGAELENRGITNVNEFLNTIPGVSVAGAAPGLPDINMRGVSTTNGTPGGSRATTAVYLDEFPISSGTIGTRDLRLIDMERVEAIKGPQGTLYGKSAMGGIIRYITNKPNTDAMTGNVSSYVSDTADSDGLNYGVNGHINIPVNDNLAVRLVGYHYDNDGFVDVVGGFPEEDADKEDTSGGRLAVRWNISDRATLDFVYLNQRLDAGVPLVTETFDLTAAGSINLQSADFSDPSAQTNIERLTKDELFNLKLDVEFDAFNLSLMASDKAFFSERYIDQGGYLNLTNSHAFQTGTFDVDTTSFEARLVSNNNGSDFIDWIVGVWYEDFEEKGSTVIDHIGPDATPFGIPATEGFVYQDSEVLGINKELAFYGEVSMHFSEQATLTLGYRRADVEVDQDAIRANGPLAGGVRRLIGIDQLTQEDVNTYKANFEYQLNDDVMLYALASSGYRAGGFNSANPLAGTPPSTFGSDTLWNYEVGAKTSWLDNRLVVNGSVFLVDWSDIQLARQLFGTTGVATITDNVGEAEIKGLELEVDYRMTEYLKLGVSLSNLDGKVTKLDPSVPVGVAVEGERLSGSAELTHTFYVDYVRPVRNDMDMSVRLTQRYIGDRLSAMGSGGSVQAANVIPSYDTTDLRIGFNHSNGIEASLFVNNMFNNISYTWIENMPQYTRWRTTLPKVMGLNVSYKF